MAKLDKINKQAEKRFGNLTGSFWGDWLDNQASHSLPYPANNKDDSSIWQDALHIEILLANKKA